MTLSAEDLAQIKEALGIVYQPSQFQATPPPPAPWPTGDVAAHDGQSAEIATSVQVIPQSIPAPIPTSIYVLLAMVPKLSRLDQYGNAVVAKPLPGKATLFAGMDNSNVAEFPETKVVGVFSSADSLVQYQSTHALPPGSTYKVAGPLAIDNLTSAPTIELNCRVCGKKDIGPTLLCDPCRNIELKRGREDIADMLERPERPGPMIPKNADFEQNSGAIKPIWGKGQPIPGIPVIR
jgi:hypothetical protein